MMLKPGQLPILLTNVAMALVFFLFYSRKGNSEFLLYIGVIVFFLFIILWTNKKVNYSNPLLWGLTLWAAMHMAGGSIPVGEGRLYDVMVLPLTADVIRYDQLVHMIGFGVATLLMYRLLHPLLRGHKQHRVALGIVVIMAGLGVGALNEIIEFSITLLVPDTGIGGYTNTSLDLVADLVGALAAFLLIAWNEKKEAQ